MGIGVVHAAHFSVYNVIGGSGGILPQENLPGHMSVFMRKSCREHHNGHWSVTQAIHHMVISQSPFSSESALVFETMLHNCLLGAADLSALCLQCLYNL